MPEDTSKHQNFNVNLPYPEIMVERPNIDYANMLLEDYSGSVSEHTAVNLYVYQRIMSGEGFDDYSTMLGSIAKNEMKHLLLLGKTIKLLGVKPIYINHIYPPGQLWTPLYVNFTTYIRDMLLEDIKAESIAIETYKYHMDIIKDKYIKKLLERIILDEQLHLELFKGMLEKYK